MDNSDNRELLRQQLRSVKGVYFLGILLILTMMLFIYFNVLRLNREPVQTLPDIQVVDAEGSYVSELPEVMSVQILPQMTSGSFLNMQDMVLLDVRPSKIWEQNYIDGTINIPYTELETRAQTELDPDASILVICDTQQCSQQAATWLNDHGFSYVYRLNTYVLNWLTRGFPDCENCKEG